MQSISDVEQGTGCNDSVNNRAVLNRAACNKGVIIINKEEVINQNKLQVLLEVVDDLNIENKDTLKLMIELNEWEHGIQEHLVKFEEPERWEIYKEIVPFIPQYLQLLSFLKCIYTQQDNITDDQYQYFLQVCQNDPEKSRQIREHLIKNVNFKFPNEYMTIYRGEHGLSDTDIGRGHTASKDVQHGISWTYEPSVAGFFAVRTQSDDCRIYTAKVHKDDVLLIYDERTEAEVIIKPMCLGTKLLDLHEEKIECNISVMREFYKYRENEHKKYESEGEDSL